MTATRLRKSCGEEEKETRSMKGREGIEGR
jgi:hypothetical protein